MRAPEPLHPAAAQKPVQALHQSFRHNARSRAWRVIHACEYARDVLPLVEAQIGVGMRPYIVTPQGAGTAELYLSGRAPEQPRALSLLRSWQDVRNWRKSILECDPENSADLVHAHNFAAGMAAVRSTGGVVYDLDACIEELAIAAGQCEPGSWMGRSFRVAEQFVLARAGAVVVHSSAMREAARERGALPENTFVIPEPLWADEQPALAHSAADSDVKKKFGWPDSAVVFFIPQFTEKDSTTLGDEQKITLEAFARAVNDDPGLRLLLQVAEIPGLEQVIRESISQLRMDKRIAMVDSHDSAEAWESADVIIAIDCVSDLLESRLVNQACISAMVRGKPVLAADGPRTRDASANGRGCLWFERNNPTDLNTRIAFLARNPDFRRALGFAGRTHIAETRSASAIGKKYQEAYQHAFSRRKTSGPGTGMATLEPAVNWG
jgi:glycosyltransferase involved in cell wall biosynthesis